jgi:MYXO-CTERM domain-containing protein
MNVKTFTLAGIAAPLFIASVSDAAITGLVARFVDPTSATQAGGSNGTWADNGYPTTTLDTWRIYAVSDVLDAVNAVGDGFMGPPDMTITTTAATFFNSIGALGNNGLQRPTDLTAIPGAMGYTGQWDSFLALDSLTSVSFAPGLVTALGATSMGMGGLVGNSFSLANSGWFTTPAGPNMVLNMTTGDYEGLIAQFTVAEGENIEMNGVGITGLTANYTGLSVSTIPTPGALALLGLAGLAARRRSR